MLQLAELRYCLGPLDEIHSEQQEKSHTSIRVKHLRIKKNSTGSSEEENTCGLERTRVSIFKRIQLLRKLFTISESDPGRPIDEVSAG